VRILVTGGSGFIGAGVVKALAGRGDHVIAFDIAGTARLDAILAQHSNAEFVQGEITEWPHVMSVVQAKKPDAVVHCAAIVGVTNSLASPIGTLRVNVEGSLNVFEAMRLLGRQAHDQSLIGGNIRRLREGSNRRDASESAT
jgi:UDP-glucose 4-epimerase